jgi:hypothetical protein
MNRKEKRSVTVENNPREVESLDESEWLARQFEEQLAPEKVNQARAERAKEFYEDLVTQYGAEEATRDAFEVIKAGADATLLVRAALQRAVARAARATAAALRSGKL